ncbi:hypothetical protein MLD38_016248 [Melastoma candidum]|uniref:Uncharacterized protein n=1 Tax=Melastoma candidum TaxID=119954 RepID=A0ACB9RIY9_9MYRT|nr:hypothetical protein MLD38_016248 [Melastoma candidum]
MASSLGSIISLVFLLHLVSLFVVAADIDTKLLSRTCNGEVYPFGSDYAVALKETMEDLYFNVPKSSVLDYYCRHTYSTVTLYGHGVCTSSLSPHDCEECIGSAGYQLFEECTHSIGAQVQLMDCRLRLLSRTCNLQWRDVPTAEQRQENLGGYDTMEGLIANTWNSSALDYYCQHMNIEITFYGDGCIWHANKECTHSVRTLVQLMYC